MSRATPLLHSDSLLRKSALVLGGSLLIAVAAQVSIPMFPVPMTLQTLAVLLVGLTLGSRLGALAVITYLAEGAMGLPVFANGMNGAALVGPTAGFLFGFVAVAYIAGFTTERGMARGVVATAIAAMVASSLVYVPGLAWLTTATPLDLAGATKVGALPFLLGDAVKAVLAALIVTGAAAARKS